MNLTHDDLKYWIGKLVYVRIGNYDYHNCFAMGTYGMLKQNSDKSYSVSQDFLNQHFPESYKNFHPKSYAEFQLKDIEGRRSTFYAPMPSIYLKFPT